MAVGKASSRDLGPNDAAEPLARHLEPSRGVIVEITPLAGFAVGALVVAALALTFSVGRHFPPSSEIDPLEPVESFEEIRRRPVVHYNQIRVDRGNLP